MQEIQQLGDKAMWERQQTGKRGGAHLLGVARDIMGLWKIGGGVRFTVSYGQRVLCLAHALHILAVGGGSPAVQLPRC